MISERAVQLAVVRGLISPEQAESLRSIEAEEAPPEPRDEERLRFISGFADIFVTIGIALFLGAGAYFGLRLIPVGGDGLAVAAASWPLAEYFTRKRRMALPSIVLLLAFAGGIFYAAKDIALGFIVADGESIPFSDMAAAFLSAGIATAAAAALHYARFRVPITIAAGAGALVAIVCGGLGMILPYDLAARLFNPVLFCCGAAIFALAMRFDAKDPLRETRRTDIAFWLHLLAAPMIVHPLISGFLSPGLNASGSAAFAILGVFFVLALVAIMVDRRAVLVSGLAYAGIAFGALVEKVGIVDRAFPLTVLMLGAFILLLSAGWSSIRARLLRLLPARLTRVLPPERTSAT